MIGVAVGDGVAVAVDVGFGVLVNVAVGIGRCVEVGVFVGAGNVADGCNATFVGVDPQADMRHIKMK